jgi:uncharacterized protein (TIGR02246 family)
MTVQIPRLANEYVEATNNGEPARFLALFADDALVRDAGREHRGREAIRDWSQREIFGAQVTIDVLDVAERDGRTVLTTKVDGNFDRTGLPDPVIIEQRLQFDGDVIRELECVLKQ